MCHNHRLTYYIQSILEIEVLLLDFAKTVVDMSVIAVVLRATTAKKLHGCTLDAKKLLEKPYRRYFFIYAYTSGWIYG